MEALYIYSYSLMKKALKLCINGHLIEDTQNVVFLAPLNIVNFDLCPPAGRRKCVQWIYLWNQHTPNQRIWLLNKHKQYTNGNFDWLPPYINFQFFAQYDRPVRLQITSRKTYLEGTISNYTITHLRKCKLVNL